VISFDHIASIGAVLSNSPFGPGNGLVPAGLFGPRSLRASRSTAALATAMVRIFGIFSSNVARP
jgi:hypothetical protein